MQIPLLSLLGLSLTLLPTTTLAQFVPQQHGANDHIIYGLQEVRKIDLERLNNPNWSKQTLGDPAKWTPKMNHCTTNANSPLIEDCRAALIDLPIPHGNRNSDDECYNLPNNGWKQLKGPNGWYKAKGVRHYVVGKSGQCGVAVYDPKGFTHCVIREDVEEAVERIIGDCSNPLDMKIEGWTDIRHAPGGGRRIVQIYKTKECVPGEGGEEGERCSNEL